MRQWMDEGGIIRPMQPAGCLPAKVVVRYRCQVSMVAWLCGCHDSQAATHLTPSMAGGVSHDTAFVAGACFDALPEKLHFIVASDADTPRSSTCPPSELSVLTGRPDTSIVFVT